MSDIIEKELLASISEDFDEEEEYVSMNEEVKNAKEPKEGISLIKKYEDLLKGANKKINNIVEKQAELMKRFKDSNEFFDGVGLSQSNIYFKIRLHKLLCKFPVLKNSTLTSSYFNRNFKVIKKICKSDVNTFGEKKQICSIFFLYFLSLLG